MAEELKQKCQAKVEFIKSSGGRYEVTVDGKLIFSKAQSGRFPNEGEIVKLIGKK